MATYHPLWTKLGIVGWTILTVDGWLVATVRTRREARALVSLINA
jgi:hypothetical protein